MRTGDEVKVRVKKQINNSLAQVELVETGERALLKIKGRLRVLKDGTVMTWVIQHNIVNGDIILGNAYFGKYDISPGITARYLSILEKVFNSPEEVTDEEISVLKGMVNRCIKRDQWDWYTTYKYLGYPTYSTMNMFVKESVKVRDDLRNNERASLLEFKEKYSFLLRSIALHLDDGVHLEELNEDEPIEELEQELWDRMSFDSKNNIRIAEKIAGSASKYILMHYLVTIEQEFFAHYIQPFINERGNQINTSYRSTYMKTNHEILTGKTHFSLGSIYYLGKNIDDKRALRDSDAMKEFHDYLGDKIDEFKIICNIVGSQIICGLQITELRNGLAHGNAEVISKIGPEAYKEIHDVLFASPNYLMKRILKNSMNY